MNYLYKTTSFERLIEEATLDSNIRAEFHLDRPEFYAGGSISFSRKITRVKDRTPVAIYTRTFSPRDLIYARDFPLAETLSPELISMLAFEHDLISNENFYTPGMPPSDCISVVKGGVVITGKTLATPISLQFIKDYDTVYKKLVDILRKQQ